MTLFGFGYVFSYAIRGAAGGILLVTVLVLLSGFLERELLPLQNVIEVAVAFAALGAFCGASYGAYKLGR